MNNADKKPLPENGNGIEKKVADMTIGDVLQTKVFYAALCEVIDNLKDMRRYARQRFGKRLKAHPIDELIRRGDFKPDKFTVLYAKTMGRKSNDPARVRTFVLQVGNEAFNKAVKSMLEHEKKRDQRNGDN